MDESKFVIKNNQSFKVLINVHEKLNWKVIQSKQK